MASPREGNSMEPKLVSAKELAIRYGLHPKTVWKYARLGTLPKVQVARRCVRFEVAECDAVLKRRTFKSW